MRHLLFATVALCALSSPSFADVINVDTKLKSAIIYAGAHNQGQAQLMRNVKTQIPAGAHTIVIENLPANIYTSSLTAKASGSAEAIMGAVSYRLINHIGGTDQEKQVLEDERDGLQYKIKMLQAEKQALQKKQSFMDFINQNAATKVNEESKELNLDPQKWIEAASTIFSSSEQTLKNILEKDQQIQDIQKQINKINKDLAQMGQNRKSSYTVEIPVEVQKSGAIDLELSYQIPQVGWTPIYDARLSTVSGKMDLKQYAKINQKTGEDWKDIKLTLSTARPHQGAAPPPLYPRWVSLQQKNKKLARSMGFAQNEIVSSVSMESDMMMAKAAVPIQQESAELDTTGMNVTYAIPGKVSVASGNTQSKVYITDYDVKTNLKSHIQPQQSLSAYLMAEMELQGEASLLAGEINLFRDGSSVGKTFLQMLRPGKKQDLAFGVDDRIAIEYKIIEDEKGEDWVPLAGDQSVIKYTKTRITNTASKPVDIVVLQNIPASKDEKIKVKIDKDQTSQSYKEDYNDIKGLLAWQKNLKSDKEAVIELGYEVSWPKDTHINGLPQ